MTFLLFVLGVVLAVYGLAEERDVVVLAGALVAAISVAIARFAGRPRGESVSSDITAQIRRDIEERSAGLHERRAP